MYTDIDVKYFQECIRKYTNKKQQVPSTFAWFCLADPPLLWLYITKYVDL